MSNEEIGIALGFLVVAITGFILFRVFRKRPNPEEIERQRREYINLHGKIGDCEILDLDRNIVHFTYGVAGVIYTAAQDVSVFLQSFPADPMVLIGPALLKYDPRNPANSIVVCEAWSGLPKRE